MRIRPLTLAAVGLALAVYDLRLGAFDLLPDAIGWALVALAAHRLGMRWPAGLAAVAAMGSLAELVLPYEYEAFDLLTGKVISDPGPNTDYDEHLVFLPLEGIRLALVVGALVLAGTAVTLMLVELRRRAATTSDRESTATLKILSWAVPLGWVVPYTVIAIGWTIDEGSFDPVWSGTALELVAVVGILIATAVALFFATRSNRRWSASGDEIGSPWADLMVRDLED